MFALLDIMRIVKKEAKLLACCRAIGEGKFPGIKEPTEKALTAFVQWSEQTLNS